VVDEKIQQNLKKQNSIHPSLYKKDENDTIILLECVMGQEEYKQG
jgi:hypothetical protein